MIKNLKNYFNRHYFEFLLAMTEKEIKARYKHTVFGFLWVVINPLFQMLVIGFVFSFFIKIPNYYTFLFAGLLPWQFFTLSLTKATPSFVHERSLLQKAKLAKEVIPISIILSNFFHLLAALVLLFIFLGLTGQATFSWLLIIPTLFWLLMFTIGTSLFTSSLNVRFRDINFFVQSGLVLWFYLTPILYNLSLIPARLRPLFALNPLSSIFELFHFSVLGQGHLNQQMLFTNIFLTLITISLGIITYRKHHPYFVDWL